MVTAAERVAYSSPSPTKAPERHLRSVKTTSEIGTPDQLVVEALDPKKDGGEPVADLKRKGLNVTGLDRVLDRGKKELRRRAYVLGELGESDESLIVRVQNLTHTTVTLDTPSEFEERRDRPQVMVPINQIKNTR